MQYVFWLIGDENRPPLAKELKFDPSGKCKVTAANPFGKIRFVLITLEATVGRIDRPNLKSVFSCKEENFSRIGKQISSVHPG